MNGDPFTRVVSRAEQSLADICESRALWHDLRAARTGPAVAACGHCGALQAVVVESGMSHIGFVCRACGRRTLGRFVGPDAA